VSFTKNSQINSIGFAQSIGEVDLHGNSHSKEVVETGLVRLEVVFASASLQFYLVLFLEQYWHCCCNSSANSLAKRGYDLILRYTQQYHPDQWPNDDDNLTRRIFLTSYSHSLCFPRNPELLDALKGVPLMKILGSGHAVEMLVTVYGDKYPQVLKDSEQHMFYVAKSAQRGCWRGTQGLMKSYLDQETADPTHPWLARKGIKKAAQLGNEEADAALNTCSGPDCQACDPTRKSFKRCSRCLIRIYCSPECQRAHWKNGHKQESATLCRGHDEVRDQKQDEMK